MPSMGELINAHLIDGFTMEYNCDLNFPLPRLCNIIFNVTEDSIFIPCVLESNREIIIWSVCVCGWICLVSVWCYLVKVKQ